MDVDLVIAFHAEARGNIRFKSIGKKNTGLETRSWKVVTRALKNEISDEANAVWLLNAQARSAAADKNVSVPELKNI